MVEDLFETYLVGLQGWNVKAYVVRIGCWGLLSSWEHEWLGDTTSSFSDPCLFQVLKLTGWEF